MNKIKISVYEPPMCCSSGVCGPDVDDKLVKFSETVKKLKNEGYEVERNSMNHNPFAFQQNQTILNQVNDSGTENLPIIEINEEILTMGEYADYNEIKAKITAIEGGSNE
ncbi:MAG: arsenical resistance operon trans-acting repressor ArsD [Halanaerobium sp. T82-1]|nr:MAG: arsenical resistance operon trans-acting repressor ArsD [Halanaerobium sp. T82-1]